MLVMILMATGLISGCFPSCTAAHYEPVEVRLEAQSGRECGQLTTGRHRIRFLYPDREVGKTYGDILSVVTPAANEIQLRLESPDGSSEEVGVALSAYTKSGDTYFTTVKNDLRLWAGVYCLSYSNNGLSATEGAHFSISRIPSP